MDINLTQGKVATIDDVDADLAAFNWHAHKDKKSKSFYAQRNVPKPDGSRTAEYIHQEIARRMGINGGPDHIDRNGLNNCRDNLRPANDSQNQGNVGIQVNNTSGFKGVSWYRPGDKWRARIMVDGKTHYLGYFTDPIEAAKAYDVAALKYFGEFAFLNFPSPHSL